MVEDFDAALVSQGIDTRYGVVGFGEAFNGVERQHAHSHLANQDTNLDDAERLFSSSAEDIRDAFQALDEHANHEDGWDAIEHAVAEYDFDGGVVPIFVLVQNTEGRNPLNGSLTRSGVFASLQSSNIVLNSIVFGQPSELPQTGDELPQPLFDLARYNDGGIGTDNFPSDIRILGVEADIADGLADALHAYHWEDVDAGNGVASTTSTTAHSLQATFNGSNTGATGMVSSGKSVLFGTNITGGVAVSDAGYQLASMPFEFVDISGDGNAVAPGNSFLLGDNEDLGTFSFPFYDKNSSNPANLATYNEIYIHPDGVISFGDAAINGANIDLADPTVLASLRWTPLVGQLTGLY